MPVPVVSHVLFPIDFSSPCAEVTPCVRAIAHQFRARVTFIHVTRSEDGTTEMSGEFPAGDSNRANRLETRLTEAFDQDFSQISTESWETAGDPTDVITQFVHRRGVDLIMMRTYGHGPFLHSSLGSVAQGVLEGALCPVWTAAHAEKSPAGHCPCRSVVCAVDATPKSTPVIEWAARFSRDSGARLGLVHVGRLRTSGLNDAQRAALRNQVAETIEGLQRMVGVRAPVSIVFGAVAEEVQAESLRQQADVLVIGRGLLDTTRGRLGRDSRGIIQRAPCPVVSV